MLALVMQDNLEAVRQSFAVKVVRLMNYYQVSKEVRADIRNQQRTTQMNAYTACQQVAGRQYLG
jgi:hypothetical protein